MDIYEILDVEKDNFEELKNKYQKMLYMYELGMITYNDDLELYTTFQGKKETLEELGKEIFSSLKLEEFELSEEVSKEIFSKIYSILNVSSLQEIQVDQLISLLSTLPDCGMKFYLMARIRFPDVINPLRFNVSTATDALNNLNKAIEYEPSNLLYIEYSNLLAEALKAYEIREQNRLKETQRELEERRKREAEAVGAEALRKLGETILPPACFICCCCGTISSWGCC